MCNEVTTSLSSTLHYSVYIFRFLHKRHVCLPVYGQGRRLGNVYCGIFYVCVEMVCLDSGLCHFCGFYLVL